MALKAFFDFIISLIIDYSLSSNIDEDESAFLLIHYSFHYCNTLHLNVFYFKH